MTSPVPPQSNRFDLRFAALSWSEFQRTKVYDLLAGLPLTAWFALSASRQFTIVAEELKRAHSGVLDALGLISLLGKFMALIFVATLLVLSTAWNLLRPYIKGTNAARTGIIAAIVVVLVLMKVTPIRILLVAAAFGVVMASPAAPPVAEVER